MKKITLLLAFFILGFLPTIVFAKMGYLFPEDEYGSGGSGGFALILWLVSIAGVCVSYIALIGNMKEWNAGKEMRKLKLTSKDFAIYMVIGFFISLPFLFWISNYRYEDNNLQVGIIVYVVALALMLFFRR